MYEHAAIVQSYFQKRVDYWFETVGKKIFGIVHYWLRYEFAPSRGQIHAHFLAICRDKKILYELHNTKEDTKQQAELLSLWAKRKFDLTATYCRSNSSATVYDPTEVKFSAIKDQFQDDSLLLEKLQMHKCNSYCLATKYSGEQVKQEKSNI